MRKFVALVTLAALGLGAQAAAAQGFSYNLVEGSLISGDDYDGFGVSGSLGFTPEIFGMASIDALELDAGPDASLLSLGAGYRIGINELLDVFGTAAVKRFKIDGAGSEMGFGVGIGARGMPMDRLELLGTLEYRDVGDFGSDTVFRVGGRWSFTPAFAAGIDYQDDDIGSALRFVARFDFGSNR